MIQELTKINDTVNKMSSIVSKWVKLSYYAAEASLISLSTKELYRLNLELQQEIKQLEQKKMEQIILRNQSQLCEKDQKIVTQEELEAYGYTFNRMYPIRYVQAKELHRLGYDIFMLYPDNTEALVSTEEDIENHAFNGGLFGLEGTN